MLIRSLLVMCLCASVAGCCKSKGSGSSDNPAAPTVTFDKAPTPKWSDHSVEFEGLDRARGSFLVSDLSYSVSFHSFPAGTRFVINNKEEPVSAGGSYTTKVDISEQIGALAPKDATDYRYKLDPKLPITIKFPGTAELALQAPAQTVWFSLERVLKKVADTPVRFGNEQGAAPKEHSILLLGASHEVLGPATTMREVDWIAVREPLTPRKGKMCDGYSDVGKDKKGAKRSLPMEMADEEVAIYERTTSKLVSKKVFKASERCPMFASGDTAKTYPDLTEIKRWLRQARTGR